MKLHTVFLNAMTAVVMAVIMSANVSFANEATPLADDPVVEQRLNTIAEELRCLVCQNESLAGSRAGLALDLRRELRGLIKAGKSDAEIKDFMVNRYGDFVLYRPPVKPQTWLLWFAPLIVLLIGLLVLLRTVKQSQNKNSRHDDDDWDVEMSIPTLENGSTTNQKDRT
ncbi:MAG TPA: cytochrome c-type biogenesis protein CcmH [Burkholderiaceae bacterium]|nr:cytochrome c-type biogenesis protein CcmH [Burkholderiaceae bacterium]